MKEHIKKPTWIKTKLPSNPNFFKLKKELESRKLNTVCVSAKCPNIGECWSNNTATFMVLGDTCTRRCKFCAVNKGKPSNINQTEITQIIEAIKIMNLKYVVITMVTRDDLEDGGAKHLANVIKAIKNTNKNIIVEILTSDFASQDESLKTILNTQPDVFGHNIEVVKKYTPEIRDRRFSYEKSLEFLQKIKKYAPYKIYTKSGFNIGFGENILDIKATLLDLKNTQIDFVTIGQYLQPTPKQVPTIKFWTPQEFNEIKKLATKIGFLGVSSGALVRSSYMAHKLYYDSIINTQNYAK